MLLNYGAILTLRTGNNSNNVQTWQHPLDSKIVLCKKLKTKYLPLNFCCKQWHTP